jgi:hypothetical protein
MMLSKRIFLLRISVALLDKIIILLRKIMVALLLILLKIVKVSLLKVWFIYVLINVLMDLIVLFVAMFWSRTVAIKAMRGIFKCKDVQDWR